MNETERQKQLIFYGTETLVSAFTVKNIFNFSLKNLEIKQTLICDLLCDLRLHFLCVYSKHFI